MGSMFKFRRVKNNFGNILAIAIIAVLIFSALFYYFGGKRTTEGAPTQQINIFPAIYSPGWQNPGAALIQNLGPEAEFAEFNKENSAFPMEIETEEPVAETSAEEVIIESAEGEAIYVPLIPLDELEEMVSTAEEVATESTEELATESEAIVSEVEPPKVIEFAPGFVESVLEFSDFTLPEDFTGENSDGKKIKNVQLRMSLAFEGGGLQDSLVIEYSVPNTTKNTEENSLVAAENSSLETEESRNLLTELYLSDPNSNATNNGYWLYGLPIFENWEDLKNLKIRFKYQGFLPASPSGGPDPMAPMGIENQPKGQVYLDAAWLEVEYQFEEEVSQEETQAPQEEPQIQQEEQPVQEEPLLLIPILEEEIGFINPSGRFYSDEEPIFILPKIESQNIFEKIRLFFQPQTFVEKVTLIGPEGQEISADIVFTEEDGNYKITIKKLTDFKPGNYIFEIKISRANKIYKAKTEFSWQEREEVYIPQKQFLFFLEGQPIKSKKYPDWHPEEEFRAKSKGENSGINIDVLSDDEESILVFSGTCGKKYYVILGYTNPDNYDENPASFIYNKAFPCKNGAYQHELNDLPEYLEPGTYYFLVAEEGTTGSWQPISAIHPVRIKVEYK